ncbi:unnamed protein product, partial [Meganyctiphanes norvegica]
PRLVTMNCLIVFSILLASALASPQGYGAPPPPPPPPSNGGYGAPPPPPPSNGGYGGGPQCRDGEVINVDGKCARPEVSRSVYVYDAPEQEVPHSYPPQVPPPKVEVDIVFVKTPEALEGQEPIVVPPPQKKTLVYVLSKKQEQEGQQVIEVPSGPKEKPEVYYVNYNDGENPSLPGGISLQDALNAASQTGQEIDGAANGGGGGGFGGGNGGGYGAPPPSPTYG